MKLLSGIKILAFTLAEVLITLGIIGIIAEMTIPTLINNVQDQVLKISFKKAYSVASQDWAQVVAENPEMFTARGGWSCTWPDGTTADYNAADGRVDAFKAKMNVTKTCISQKGCWPDNYEYDWMLGNTTDIGNMSAYDYSWITADGMCWGAPWNGADSSTIIVDTNCNKKPNKIGQDIFAMLLGADGTIYFTIDERSSTGAPVSKGLVCPRASDPYTINGKNVSFISLLYN